MYILSNELLSIYTYKNVTHTITLQQRSIPLKISFVSIS